MFTVCHALCYHKQFLFLVYRNLFLMSSFFYLNRDFAYVARDKVTKRYKCHVFRCDIPAKAIANALHEICARVMSERQKGHTISMVTQGQMIQQQQQQQLMQMRSISLDSNKAPTPTTGQNLHRFA